MTPAATERTRDTEVEGSRIQCEACGKRLISTAIRYNGLGYAICPGCNHEHGP